MSHVGQNVRAFYTVSSPPLRIARPVQLFLGEPERLLADRHQVLAPAGVDLLLQYAQRLGFAAAVASAFSTMIESNVLANLISPGIGKTQSPQAIR
jgi:hypothetical protein